MKTVELLWRLFKKKKYKDTFLKHNLELVWRYLKNYIYIKHIFRT